MNFYILDERKVWFEAALRAAANHGHIGRRIFRGTEVNADGGIGFIRPHVHPKVLPTNHQDFAEMRKKLVMIQDVGQVAHYENKSAQFFTWGDWMPHTWRFITLDAALEFLRDAAYPLVSKADVGASSVNVRILKTRAEAERHARLLFGPGVSVEHSSEVPRSTQKGYALFQRFIPHEVTWRVNAIGNGRAVFKRFCYPNRAVAQTGNVEPVMERDAMIDALIYFCDRFFEHARTKWCAVDVLQDIDGSWKLLETSLAWPWPSPGRCNEAPIFNTSRKWIEMFEAMFDQYEEGAWQG